MFVCVIIKRTDIKQPKISVNNRQKIKTFVKTLKNLKRYLVFICKE